MIAEEIQVFIGRTSVYYKEIPVSGIQLSCKEFIDQLHTDHPTRGSRQMSKQLQRRGFSIGRKKACRYITSYANIWEARTEIGKYIHTYNCKQLPEYISRIKLREMGDFGLKR